MDMDIDMDMDMDMVLTVMDRPSCAHLCQTSMIRRVLRRRGSPSRPGDAPVQSQD